VTVLQLDFVDLYSLVVIALEERSNLLRVCCGGNEDLRDLVHYQELNHVVQVGDVGN